MLFNSWGYLLFLFAGVALHWLLPHRFRTLFLGAASVAFYAMWRWEFSLLMIFSAVVDFVAAARVHASPEARSRKLWLTASLVTNLGLLVAFKYTYFIYDNIRFLGAAAGADLPSLQGMGIKIILPLGISFYTFQTISYTIDVYRGVARPTRRFGDFLAYVTFWPQLIAGPILRVGEVLPQLQARRRFSVNDLAAGGQRLIFGLFKKVVIADNLAPLVERAFNADPGALTGVDIWVAVFLFGFQIYYDFSGYSDVAIGSARMLGIRFPENFDFPYMARSPRDFWKRWHISLSAWIRDYLYLPLSGARFRTESTGGLAVAADDRGRRRSRALFLTWFIMGLWHGAGWTFAIWGLYHAVLIWLYRKIGPLGRLETRRPALGWALMLGLSMLGWLPFRARSLEQLGTLAATLVDPSRYGLADRALAGHAYLVAALLLLGTTAAGLIYRWRRDHPMPAPAAALWTAASGAAIVFLVLVYLRPVRQFIYFQF